MTYAIALICQIAVCKVTWPDITATSYPTWYACMDRVNELHGVLALQGFRGVCVERT